MCVWEVCEGGRGGGGERERETKNIDRSHKSDFEKHKRTHIMRAHAYSRQEIQFCVMGTERGAAVESLADL